MNIIIYIIVVFLLIEYFLYNYSRYLNVKNISIVLPSEFNNYYSPSDYAKSQHYLIENTRFSYLTSTLDILLLFLLILLAGKFL